MTAFQALFEVAAEPGAGQERARIEREHLGLLQRLRSLLGEEVGGQALGHSGLADPGLAHKHRVVLPPSAEHLDRALEFGGPTDERVEQAPGGPVGERGRIGRERVAGARRRLLANAGRRLASFPGERARGHLGNAVVDEFEDVQPADALVVEEVGGQALGLLQDGGQDVAGVHFLPLRALDVENRRLQHAPEGGRLLGLALLPALELFDGFLEIFVERLPQLRQIGATAGENALALAVVRQREEQVFERQVGMPPRNSLAVGDRQDDFQGG